ncbi:hypothetical protein [Mycobacterium sp. URHB0021]
MTDFDPDSTTLRLLQAEHQNGVWVGKELLPIANRIRNAGGSEDDFMHWVKVSNLWCSYTGSTSDSASDQRRHLASAWDKSERSKPFDLEDALTNLEDRISRGYWTGRSGSRNRAVALAFVGFCRDHNCFTRTMSRYELSKHTAGMSPNTVGKGLDALVEMKLLSLEDRTDKRTSSRSTTRYQINFYWKPERLGGADPEITNSVNDSRSTSKYSLTPLRSNRDLWSYRGLGETAGRVYQALADEPATVRELSAKAGLSEQSARRAAEKLADHCLAGLMPGRPVRYFKVETPLGVIEDSLGCTGYVEHVIAKTERRQQANRLGYPANYTQPSQESDDRT